MPIIQKNRSRAQELRNRLDTINNNLDVIHQEMTVLLRSLADVCPCDEEDYEPIPGYTSAVMCSLCKRAVII